MGGVTPAKSHGIAVVSSNWFNAGMNYQQFMVPGILVILVTMVVPICVH